ncbi:hypothetical protein BpHYR1_049114, partial [Brachionus plicatilis]
MLNNLSKILKKPMSCSKFCVYSVGYFFQQPQKRTGFIIKQSNRKQFGVMVQIEELEFFKHCQKETLSKILHNPRSPRVFSFESALIAFYDCSLSSKDWTGMWPSLLDLRPRFGMNLFLKILKKSFISSDDD